MSNLHPYLTFNGNAAEAISFYQEALNAKVEYMQNYENSPVPVDEKWKQKVLHATITVNGGTVMISDGTPDQQAKFGNNVSLALNFKDNSEIENSFSALAAGGKIKMPLQKTFWAKQFGMLEDKFGIHWMFNHA